MAEVLERLSAALADRYSIERELGAGGMATVYLARDLRHDRAVAIKVLRPELAASLGAERFLLEIKTTAQLTHPNILPLLDSGEADGLLYYAMPFVEGESLRGRLSREKQLPLVEALRITREVADALGHAHSHGVIHRDVKPENILLESGHAVVADFGIARAVRAAGGERLTQTGFTVGTPEYMSPEQAAGNTDLDGRSDLYSLGCVLFEMLSGVMPYSGGTPLEILARKLSEPVPRVSVGRKAAPGPVEAVLTKVLATRPEDRFATASEFTAALEGEPFAKLVTAGARRRRRRFAIAGAALLVVVSASTVLARYLGVLRPGGPPVIGSVSQLTSDPGIEMHPSLSPDGKWIVYAGDQSGNKDIYRRAVGGLNAIDLTKDSPEDDDEPAFSPDGDRIAFRSEREGGGIFVMGPMGEAVRRVTRKGFRPTWSPDGTEIAFVTEDVPLLPQNQFSASDLWVADVKTEKLRHLNAGDAVTPSWSPHGLRIAYMKRMGHIWTIPARGGQPVAATNDKFTNWNPTWSPDGKYLYFASDRGGSMNLWRVPIDEKSGKTLGSPEPITVPTPDLKQISVAAGGREIAYSSATVQSNIQTATLDPTAETVVGEPTWVTTGSRIWVSPDPSWDGQWVTFYDYDQGHIYVQHPDGSGLRQVTGDTAADRNPRWSPDGKWIAFFSSGRAREIQIWEIRSDGSELRRVTDADNGVSYDAWSPDGTRLMGSMVLRGVGETVVFDPNRPWGSQRRQVLPAAGEAFQPFYMNSWSLDGQRLCGGIGPRDNGILTYEFRTGRYERLTDYGEWPVWLPDSRHILFVSGGGKAFYIVDRITKQVRRIFTAGRDVLGPPRLTRDGRHMFYSRRVTEADLWMVTLK
ncbi:MAG: protein kinase [Gemmatimonadales bacterium]|jgi:Tol biopolymer transport system component